MQGHVYHWKHGWIPLTHYAALQKAHGSHKGAQKYLSGSNGSHGTHSTGSASAHTGNPRTVSTAHEVSSLKPGDHVHVKGESVTVPGTKDSATGHVAHVTSQVKAKPGAKTGERVHVVSIKDNNPNTGMPRERSVAIPTGEKMRRDHGGAWKPAEAPRAGGKAELVKSDVHGDGRTDHYSLPSGHVVSVDRQTGRVHNPFKENTGGHNAIDANPGLLEKRSVGTSMAHDDHYVLKGHKPATTPEKPAVNHGALTNRLSREDLAVAQQRGRMTPQQVREYISETSRIAAQAQEARSPRTYSANEIARGYDNSGKVIPKAADAHRATPSAEQKRVQIDHSGDGTLLHIDRADTEARDAAKAAGFKWSSNLGAWYLPRNWGESTRRSKVSQLQAKIGHEHIHVSDGGHASTTTAAEREAMARSRAASRAEHMDAKAQKAASEADARFGRAHDIGSGIPMGQPILVGHHSEGRHRADIKRIDTNMRKGVEAHQASKDATAAAERARQTAAGDSPLARQRRIDRNEAEVRKIDRALQDHGIATKAPTAAAKVGIHPMSPDHHARMTSMRAELADQIAHDKAQIAASGHKTFTSSDLKPGDIVHYRGSPHVVAKVNKTTVSVPSGYSWHDKVPINQITDHLKLADLSDAQIRQLAESKDPKVREHYIKELNRRGLKLGN